MRPECTTPAFLAKEPLLSRGRNTGVGIVADLNALWATIPPEYIQFASAAIDHSIGPIAAAFLGYIAAMKRLHADAVKDRRDRAIADEIRREAEHQARLSENSAQTQALYKGFETLMDAAEARIDDLMHEVDNLRGTVEYLRKRLDFRAVVCAGCDRFAESIRGNPPDGESPLNS